MASPPVKLFPKIPVTGAKGAAKTLDTKGPAIGRYERDEMTPSIEVAKKLQDFSISVVIENLPPSKYFPPT